MESKFSSGKNFSADDMFRDYSKPILTVTLHTQLRTQGIILFQKNKADTKQNTLLFSKLAAMCNAAEAFF